MKVKFLATVLICSVLLATVNESCACSNPTPPRPVAVLEVPSNSALIGTSIAFDGSSSYSQYGTITKYEWDFGDGFGYVGNSTAVHAYENSGTYTVWLRVTNSYNKTDTASYNVYISPLECPDNGSRCQSTSSVTLNWGDVSDATYYKVYFGTNTNPQFRSNTTASSTSVGSLQPGTRYYWRLKTKRDGCYLSGYSSMWYFTTAIDPCQATNPSQDDSSGDAVLSWIAGSDATSHDVYFGTDPNELQFMDNEIQTSYNFGELEPGVYYWRIDEVTDCKVTEGDVWSFTVHKVWYVNNGVSGGFNNGTSWENAFFDLQSALDVADPNGDEIWVAQGSESYYPSKKTNPNDPNSVTFQLVNGLMLYGGFGGTETSRNERDLAMNVTTLSGNTGEIDDTNDNCYHIIKCEDVNNVVLDGFSIINGNANGHGADSNGAGIYCSGSSLEIRRCVFAWNTSESNGGGLYCADSNIAVTDCILSENETGNSGGGIYNLDSVLTVENSTFNYNLADYGGGIYGSNSNVAIKNSIFWDNTAGSSGDEIYNDSSEPNFSYCDIKDCNNGGSWDSSLGVDDGGNIDLNPQFVALQSTQNLVSYWQFDEGDGNTVYDFAGNNNGTVYGASWVEGQVDYALEFNGTSDYVSTTTTDLPSGNAPRTLSIWVKWDSNDSTDVIYGYGSGSAGNMFGLFVHSNSSLYFWGYNSGDHDTGVNIEVGEWMHLALTYDGTYVRTYKNGLLVDTREKTLNTIVDSSVIGRNNYTGGYFFDGSVDEVSIYSRTLSDLEVRQLYQYGIAGHSDYHLQSNSPCINTGDPNGDYKNEVDVYGAVRIMAERVDIGACEATWTVQNIDNGTWYESIQGAVDAVEINNKIVAYPNIYYETVDFNGIACELASLDPNNWNIVSTTIIDANGDPCEPNSYGHVITFNNSEDANTLLAGFTITGGYVSGVSDANNGGGIYCNASSPTIGKCIVTKNTAKGNGGGMYGCNSAVPTIENCSFIANYANNGGGMYNFGDSSLMVNCTFSKNYADDYGGGIYNNNSDITLNSSILWGNDANNFGNQIYNNSSSPAIKYSCLKGCKDSNGVWDPNYGSDSGGNINYAPYFNSEQSLLSYSNCIDTGDPSLDYSNEPNDPNNIRINMGAYGNTLEAAIASVDSDNDGIPDTWELLHWPYDDPNFHDPNVDEDDDSLDNIIEYHIGTDPNNSDSDDDGMDDNWEYDYGLDPLYFGDAYDDDDNDGLNNLGEYTNNTNPRDEDSDDDQIPDGWEIDGGLNPLDSNDASGDYDNDGLTNLQEYQIGTNLTKDDTDGDGINDAWEYNFNLNPLDSNDFKADLDGDEYNNLCEYLHGSDPNDDTNMPSSNITITVPNDVVLIQSAIQASIDSDVIELLSGTYYETIDFEGKAITIRSSDPNCWNVVETTVINGNDADKVVVFDSGEDANSVVLGLTVTNGEYGINCNSSSSPTITNCIIENNSSYGVYCVSGSPLITNNKIGFNNGDGIYSSSLTPPTIRNNWIYQNNKGIEFSSANSAAVVSNNTIVDNTSQGIYVSSGVDPSISNCIFWGNDGNDLENCSAVYSCIEDGDEGTGNISYDPNFVDTDNYDYHLSRGSFCVDSGDSNGVYDGQTDIDDSERVRYGVVDIGADEFSPVHNINSDEWYGSIQDAIDDSDDGDVIELMKATYHEQIDFNGMAITLRSTDPNDWDVVAATVIEGSIFPGGPNTRAHVVTFDNYENANSVLSGLTITGGNLYASAEPEGNGGGIYCYQSNPTIKKCIITENHAYFGKGGGIYCEDTPATLIVTDCIFSDNYADLGGGLFGEDAHLAISDCTFTNNSVYLNGGGIYSEGGTLTLTNCTLSENSSDHADGGICDHSDISRITNCIFSENQVAYGAGGLSNHSSNSKIINCTFISNSTGSNGGGVCNFYSSLILANCVFWGNEASGNGDNIYNASSVNPTIRYCDIEDSNGSGDSWDSSLGTDGGGNIDMNPCFVDINNPAGPDGLFGTSDDGSAPVFFSPCIDSGNDGDIPTGITSDIKGDDRRNRTVDMGAYEYSGAHTHIIFVDKNADPNGEGTSWYDAFINLQDALAVANEGDEIWVAKGIYKSDEGINQTIGDHWVSFQLVEDVALYGGFVGGEVLRTQRDCRKNLTVLSGDIGKSDYYTDNSRHVVIGANIAIIDGFTITGGYALGTNGGGMLNYKCSPTVRNCVLTKNRASAIQSEEYTPYGGNGGAGGGMYNHDSHPIVTNCTFSGNSASGKHRHPVAGIYLRAGSGGGMCNYGSLPTVTNCAFEGNSAFMGGGIINYGGYNITNCIFSSNTATYGGGMVDSDSGGSMVNCTFSRNSDFGFLKVYSERHRELPESMLTNCIFSENTSRNPIALYSGDEQVCKWFCSIWSTFEFFRPEDFILHSLSNCYMNSPCFVDANNPAGFDGIFGTIDDGLRLGVGSSCIDAANGGAAPSTDALGLGRVDIPEVSNTGIGNPKYADMGAYESYNGVDSDGDGMQDDFEIFYGLNPETNDADADYDGDGMSNIWEYQYTLNPVIDDANDDSDNDGIPNIAEFQYGLNPRVDDTGEDADSDGMSNGWEYEHGLDLGNPNDANENSDGDGFINLVEYLFGYDMNTIDTAGMDVNSSLPEFSQVDPNEEKTLTFYYWLNKDGNVEIKFKKTNVDWNQAARTINEGWKTAGGPYEVVWDCKDDNGYLVERYFYDVKIEADNGVQTDSWISPDGDNTSYYPRSTDRIKVHTDKFDAYKNIPVEIECDMLDWTTRKVDVVQKGCSGCRINRVCDRLLKPGWNSFDWYGYWDNGVNTGKFCQQPFDVYYHVPGVVNKGAVLVYYEDLLKNLHCNPSRILLMNDEVTNISYDLTCDVNVTIKVYDPDGSSNYFTLLDNVPQIAAENPQRVVLHGTSNPDDPNSMYLSNEGVYWIEVKVENGNINDKLEGSITVYR